MRERGLGISLSHSHQRTLCTAARTSIRPYKADLYEVAYEKIKARPGNMTAGVDGTTLDGFAQDAIRTIILSLRDESFQFQPTRRVFIPKANGKTRSLGIASPRDKIVQEAMHLLLEAICDSPYGAYFLDYSHGFRPKCSCHTAFTGC